MVDDVKRRVHGQIRHGGVRKSILRLKSERTGVKRGGGGTRRKNMEEKSICQRTVVSKSCADVAWRCATLWC